MRHGGAGGISGRVRGLVPAIACAGLLALTAGSAGAAPAATVGHPHPVPQRTFMVPTPAAPGPAEYNRVRVTAFGRRAARDVLILMPGTFGGAGDFTLTGRTLARRNPQLQVWAVDRRAQELEDTSKFEQLIAGTATLKQVYDYYLGWFLDSSITDHVAILDPTTMPYARDWGMKTVLNDVRAVVNRARRGRKRVVLGGHSVGASLAISYAAWDFHGKPGFRGLRGLVLIDGGLLGSFDPYDLPQAQAAMAKMEMSGPFSRMFPGLPPESAGLFAGVGAAFAQFAPTEAATTLQNYALLPAALKPPVPVTNRGLFGYDFDRRTSPPDLSSIHVNSGHLGPDSPTPVDWVDSGITPIGNVSRAFSRAPVNAVDWFFPTRITIDANGADQMRMNDVARYLGLRLFHTSRVKLPFYVIQTDDTGGDVLKGARNWIRRTRTTRRQSVLVNADPLMSHLDPLLAAPRKNVFVKTVTPFLRKAFAPPRGKRARPRPGRR